MEKMIKEFVLIFEIIFEFIKNWWWLFLPFLLYKNVIQMYLWYKVERWAAENARSVLLEVKFPEEVKKPVKAMEQVFAAWWQIYDPPNPREFWFEGKFQLGFSIEIVSLEGKVKFFLRVPAGAKTLFKSALYAQYPDVEVEETKEDYSKLVPVDSIPNKEWELWGTAYILGKKDIYPIMTHQEFESQATEEEKRIDPLSNLIEGLATLGKGEYMWIMFTCSPITTNEDDFVKRAQEEIDKLIHRPQKPKPPGFKEDLLQLLDFMITGENPPKPGTSSPKPQQPQIPPEAWIVNPAEVELARSIDRKVSKPVFKCTARFIYIAKRDSYFGPRKAIAMSFFNQFSSPTKNFFRPLRPSLSKVHTVKFFFLDKRRTYVRKKRLMRNYIFRLPPLFPKSSEGVFILNIEELATIFHIPSRVMVPSVETPRVQVKKTPTPPEVPFEEYLED